MIGQTISHYKILEEIGQGGMGIVYKAQDTKLNRTVALKFLSRRLSTSPQDKARFVQEAQAASALNHPNVCTIHDIQDYDDPDAGRQLYIVMEFVDGQTLKERLNGGPMPLKQALDISVQVADGLAAAHEKGIVHRDIKPENIMVRKDGIVQIMDFGLAKLRSSSSKITRLTREGSTVGTAGYMSPEQVQGQDADHRSDIFSFGVLVYELCTGQLPFKGVHETALAYEIVNVDPAPMSAIVPELDPALDALVLECLEKDPNERTQSIKQLSVDLKRYRRESGRQRMSRITAARPALSGAWPAQPKDRAAKKSMLPWIIAGFSVLLALGALAKLLSVSSSESPVVTASIIPPPGTDFFLYGNNGGAAALSPDGKHLAFVAADSLGKRFIYVRPVDGSETKRLEETADALFPFWSPDSRLIGFASHGKLKKIDAQGGAAIALANAPFFRGATWCADGTIVFTPAVNSRLMAVSGIGGTPTAITRLDSSRRENSHRWPSILPDGKHVLYLARTVTTGNEEEGGAIMAASVDGTTNKLIVKAASNAVYVSGVLLYARGTTLVSQKFDPSSLELSGEPTTIAENVSYDPSTTRSQFTVSRNGLLVYQTGTASLGSRIVFRDRTGKQTGATTDIAEMFYPRFSPDGNKLSVYIWDFQSHNADIWILDIDRRLKTRFTFSPAAESWSVWSPDGRQVAFNSDRTRVSNLYVRATNGTGAETTLLAGQEFTNPDDWSSDGKFLLYGNNGATQSGTSSLWALPMDGKHPPFPVVKTEFNNTGGRFSPDGKWIAYVSDESGQREVYVIPFSPAGSSESQSALAGKRQISAEGGDAPCWRGDGKEMFYSSRDKKIMAVDVSMTNGTLTVGHPHPLFDVPSIIQLPSSDFDVTRDGKRFLMNTPFERQNQTPLTLVFNWPNKFILR